MSERVLIAAFLFASLLPAPWTCDWQAVGVDGGSPMKIWSPVAPVLGGNLTFAFQLQ